MDSEEVVDVEFSEKSSNLLAALDKVKKRVELIDSKKSQVKDLNPAEKSALKIQLLYLMTCAAWIQWRASGSEPAHVGERIKEQLSRCRRLMTERADLIHAASAKKTSLDMPAVKRFISKGLGQKRKM